MKKVLSLLISLAMGVSLAACGNADSNSSSALAPNSTAESSALSVESISSANASETPVGSEAATESSTNPDADVTSSETEESDADTTTDSGSNVLVVYFSRTSNTKTVAEFIHAEVGGDLVQLVPVTPYPENYDECTEIAQAELSENARPSLETVIENMDSYDTILLGYPIWGGTFPMPIATFLESYDFSGKTIIPFCTHGGSRFGSSISDITSIAAGATVVEGFEVQGGSAAGSQADVAAWASGLAL